MQKAEQLFVRVLKADDSVGFRAVRIRGEFDSGIAQTRADPGFDLLTRPAIVKPCCYFHQTVSAGVAQYASCPPVGIVRQLFVLLSDLARSLKEEVWAIPVHGRDVWSKADLVWHTSRGINQLKSQKRSRRTSCDFSASGRPLPRLGRHGRHSKSFQHDILASSNPFAAAPVMTLRLNARLSPGDD